MKSNELANLWKVVLDSAPPEVKARIASMMKQIELERQERLFVLSAIADAFDIIVNLRSCGGGGPNLSNVELEIATNAATKWVIRYNAVDIIERAEALMQIGEE